MELPPTPSEKWTLLATISLMQITYPILHRGQPRTAEGVPVWRVSAKTILRSSNCQIFRQTAVCFYAYLYIAGEPPEKGLLNKSSLAPFLFFSFFGSFSLSFYYYFFNEKKRKPLLAQSLKSLTCDANLSSLAPSHFCWLRACLILWLPRAGCVSVSIMKLSFKDVSEMDVQSSRQRVLILHLVIQAWARGPQPAFTYLFSSRPLGWI